jgi:hypothetical protein
VPESEDLAALRKRILLPFQIQRGSRVWAPWGVSGWSAIEVVKPSRKWAKGYRVKPATDERGAAAKIPLDRLLKRDPAQKGKDKPEQTPDEVFAHVPKEEPKKEEAKKPAPTPPPTPSAPSPPPPPPKPVSEKERAKGIQRLIDMFGDGSTTDDW